ncbi:MAG: uracil-DNA glycosylase [Oscillibacter sp.]|nr:uracil-DNA glycosylase [Oscillibacter sp.]
MTWEELETACKQCRRCALCETRNAVVFGDGARDAEILLIGEGPGEQEDKQGVPFVGPAGKLLDDMLELTGLDRTKVYIGNIVKCRPPRNRDPLNTEQSMCLPWLRRQTALLRPKLIVCLGRIAAKAVIKPDFGITREHGQWFERNGVQMTALYHPSALLRDPSKRPETFLDLLSLREKVRQVCIHTELSLPRTEPAADRSEEDGGDAVVYEKQENSQPRRENKEQENNQMGLGQENKEQESNQLGEGRENKEQENNQPGEGE